MVESNIYSIKTIEKAKRCFRIPRTCYDLRIRLFAAILKFFGHLAVVNIECLSRFSKILDSLFDLLHQFDRLDIALRLTAFDTFGAIGSTHSAKKFLNEKSSKFEDFSIYYYSCFFSLTVLPPSFLFSSIFLSFILWFTYGYRLDKAGFRRKVACKPQNETCCLVLLVPFILLSFLSSLLL